MGLRDDIQADVAAAYDTDLADAVTPFSGMRLIAQGAYDPVTGQTSGDDVITYTGRGVMGGYKAEEIDNQHVLATDIKLSGVLQNELIDAIEATPVAPEVNDTVDGYSVESVGQDPAGATWTLQLRRT